MLEQLIEESCSTADCRGMKGTRAFEKQLITFRQWCTENPPDEEMRDNSEGNAVGVTSVSASATTGKRNANMVTMTQQKKISTVERIHNTFKMS